MSGDVRPAIHCRRPNFKKGGSQQLSYFSPKPDKYWESAVCIRVLIKG